MGGMERTREYDIALPSAARLANRDTDLHRTHLLLRFLFSNAKATDDGDDVTVAASSPAPVFAVPLCC